MRFDIMTLFPDLVDTVLAESIIGRAQKSGAIYRCHKAITDTLPAGQSVHTVYLSPRGRIFSHKIAKELAAYDNLILLCGHYEGVDARVMETVVDEEISIGDFIRTGGELPACLVVDAVARFCDGVLADAECYEKESVASGLLEYPQYTRPYDFMGLTVPEVLISGHHENIEKWRL